MTRLPVGQVKMTEQQEFDVLIAGLPAKADQLFDFWTPERRAEWVCHVTDQANNFRTRFDMHRALEYLRA